VHETTTTVLWSQSDQRFKINKFMGTKQFEPHVANAMSWFAVIIKILEPKIKTWNNRK